MIAALIAGAAAARRASTQDRVVEIAVTEVGLVVRGHSTINRGADSGERRIGASGEIGWDEMEFNPALLENAVNLVVDQLQRTERGA